MPAQARIAAYHALRMVSDGRADLPAALAASRQRLTDERDRALAADIVLGAVRWQGSLDFLVAHFARRPLAAIDRSVLEILRLSLYQLLHLDRVPASAVVDDAVDLTRHARKASAAGFVNAVLRGTLRERARLPLPLRPDPVSDRTAALAYLSITHSHPAWLVARWLDRYGFEAAERWVHFNNEPPRLTLRANTLRNSRDTLAAALARDGIDTAPTPHGPDGLFVIAGNPLRAPSDGSFFVQDEASQLVTCAVGAVPGERVLDVCASPGGKTVAMIAAMRDEGLLVASDVRTRRLRLLNATVRSSGARQIRVVHVSHTGQLPFQCRFDRVLVDAPCSGLGTIRRDPDIRWRRDAADLRVFADDQLTLLRRVATVVATGGRLVYATCSSEPEENEDVIDAFLAEHRGFRAVDLRDDDTPAIVPVLDARGMLRTLPFVHGLEAFFGAAMERTS